MSQQARRFAVSGLLATGLHVLIAVSFIKLILPSPMLANGVAFAMATVFSYLINTLWSFSSRLHGKNLRRFVVVSALGCLLSVAVSGLAEHYGLPYELGIVLVVLSVPPATFLLHSFWTYR
jgi:putative flippase GtrA